MSDQWYHKYHEKYHKVIVAECVWFFLTACAGRVLSKASGGWTVATFKIMHIIQF